MLFPHDAENSFMDTSPNLALPYLLANQAQKHVTVNEALRRLDALVQLSVLSASLAATAADPYASQIETGDHSCAGSSGSKRWVGRDKA